MKTRFLFPQIFKTVGWFLFFPSIVMIIYCFIFKDYELPFLDVKVFSVFNSIPSQNDQWFSIIQNNISDEILSIFIIVGAMFIAFSKAKNEDEFIAKIRLESLLLATYFNISLFILSIIFLYGAGVLVFFMFNSFTFLLFFLIRFYFMLYRLKKESK